MANIQIKWIEEEDQVFVSEVGQIEFLQFIVDNGSALPEWCLLHDCTSRIRWEKKGNRKMTYFEPLTSEACDSHHF